MKNVPLSVVTNPIEMFADNFPDSRPLQSNTSHVVVRDLHYLQQAEHARWISVQFVDGDVAKASNERH